MRPREGRIGRVSADPLMTIRLFLILVVLAQGLMPYQHGLAQFIGKKKSCPNYYESVGQPLAAHINWMRECGYTPDKSTNGFPTDQLSKTRFMT